MARGTEDDYKAWDELHKAYKVNEQEYEHALTQRKKEKDATKKEAERQKMIMALKA